jgi:hypothetical protein
VEEVDDAICKLGGNSRHGGRDERKGRIRQPLYNAKFKSTTSSQGAASPEMEIFDRVGFIDYLLYSTPQLNPRNIFNMASSAEAEAITINQQISSQTVNELRSKHADISDVELVKKKLLLR